MPWFKVDDGLHAHPKILAAGNAAIGLWTRFGSYCSHYSTDGFVPDSVAKTYGKRAEIERLVAAGMLRRSDGGYVMHDFLDYNPSAEKVQEDRDAAAERQRQHRAAKGRKSQRDTSVTNGVSHTTPSRPVPSRPSVTTSSSVSTGVSDTTNDDDRDFDQTIALFVAARLDAQRNVRSPEGFKRVAGDNARAEHGDFIRQQLATGRDPLAIAAQLLGSQIDARRAARKLGVIDENPNYDAGLGVVMDDGHWTTNWRNDNPVQPTGRPWYAADDDEAASQ